MNCSFIVSPSYSGSTLLSMLLAHHPGLSTLGEFLDNTSRRYREGEGDFCSCGARLPECSFMSEMTRRVGEKGFTFTVDYPDTAFATDSTLAGRVLRPYIRSPFFELVRHTAIALLPAARHSLQRTIARNEAVISAINEMDGSSVYLDSAKNNNRVVYFHRYATGMDVKVIWLVRDGRGVANSIMRHTGNDMATAVRRWRTTQTSVIHTVESLPQENVMHLVYEDLCTDPDHWLPETCRFLGLDPALLPENYGAQEQHLTGNNMRLKGLGEIRLDEKWKTALSAGELAEFERVGGALNRELGYRD